MNKFIRKAVIFALNLSIGTCAYAERIEAAGGRGALNPAGIVYPIITPNVNPNLPLQPPVTVPYGPNGATQTQVGTTNFYSPGMSSVTNGNTTVYSNGSTCVSKGSQRVCN